MNTEDKKIPKVSVVCAWYNRAEYLQETIESLLCQDFDSYEVVIVNDGSTDVMVKKLLDACSDKRVKVIHQSNHGFVHAIKTAIAASRGEFVAIQGSADHSFPLRLKKQAEVLEKRENVVAVGCLVENWLSKDRIKVAGIVADGDLSKEGCNRILMMHGEVMFKRSAYDAVGGYRDFFKYSQDRDLWLRLSQIGNIVVLPDILYRRYANIGGVSGDANKQFLQRCLSYFAVYCHEERLKGKKDPLSKSDFYAALYWKQPFSLQLELNRLALSYFYFEKDGWKSILNRASKLNYGFLAAFIAKVIVGQPALARRVLKWALKVKRS